MANKGFLKALIGTGATVAGGAIGGPAGAAIGAGVGQLVTSQMGGTPNIPTPPPLVDPMQLEMLEELERKKRSIEMGTSVEFQTARELIQRSEATVVDRVASITGGDVSGAVAAMERINQATGANIGKIVAQSGQMAAPYVQAIADLNNRIAQRKLELSLAANAQALASAEQMRSDKNQSLMNVLTSETFISSLGKGGKWLVDNAGKVASTSGYETEGGMTSAFNGALMDTTGMTPPSLDLAYLPKDPQITLDNYERR